METTESTAGGDPFESPAPPATPAPELEKAEEAKPEPPPAAKTPKKSPAKKRETRARPAPRKEAKMASKKDASKNGEDKVGLGVRATTAKQVRRLRAALELKSGDRVSNSDAIDYAVKLALKE